MARWGRAATFVVAVGMVAALPACSYLDTKQRELIFRVVKAERPIDQYAAQGMQELWLPIKRGDADSGERLHAWWWPHGDAAAPSLLYLHGTRWNLTGNAFRIERLRAMGFNVLAIDYRGFGRSSGDLPEERLTYEDAAVAWAHLREREPNAARRFIYGHSLGGAVAIDLAQGIDDLAGLILESTFTSMRDMADTTIARFLPVSLMLTQRFDALAKIPNVRAPVLLVHGTGDRYVPHAMSERLYAAAPEPKRLLLVENASHSNTAWVGFDAYTRAVAELRAGSLGARASAQ